MSTKFISNLFYSFISLLMLTSCENDGVRTFSLESNIHNLNPHYQRKGYQFNVENDTLIILNDYSKDTLFEVYDLQSGQLIGKFGLLGNGPKQISQVSGVDWLPGRNEIFVGDASRINLRVINLDSALNNWNYDAPIINLPKDLYPAYFQVLSPNSFITRQMDQTDDVLLKFNAEQVYDTLGKQYRTSNPLVLGDDFIQYYFFFNGKHPTQEKYVVSYFNYDIIQIIKEDGNSIFFQGPDKVNYTDRKKEFMTYRNCALTEDYILAAYIGKESEMPAVSAPNPEEIHVISWEGEFLGKFKLDVPVHGFILSEDNSKIYAFADNENRDFVSFKIPELK